MNSKTNNNYTTQVIWGKITDCIVMLYHVELKGKNLARDLDKSKFIIKNGADTPLDFYF